MRKINTEIVKNIRNEFMKDYPEKDFQYVGNYHSLDFADYAFSKLYNSPEVNGEMLGDVYLENLCVSDGEYGIVEGEYDKEFILIRNKGKMPLELSIEQFNALDLGFYVWLEYGYFDELGVTYYDIECMEGVNTLFELPYFKRLFIILEKYLAKMELIKDSKITTNDVEVILSFNEYFMGHIRNYDCMVGATNHLLKNN